MSDESQLNFIQSAESAREAREGGVVPPHDVPPPAGMWPRYVDAYRGVWEWDGAEYRASRDFGASVPRVRERVWTGRLVVPHDDVPWDKVHRGEVRPPGKICLRGVPENTCDLDNDGYLWAQVRCNGKWCLVTGESPSFAGIVSQDAACYEIDHKTNTATLEWWRGQDGETDRRTEGAGSPDKGRNQAPPRGLGRPGGQPAHSQTRATDTDDDNAKVVTCPHCDGDHEAAIQEILGCKYMSAVFERGSYRGKCPRALIREVERGMANERRMDREAKDWWEQRKLAILRGEVPNPVFADETDAAVWSWERAVR